MQISIDQDVFDLLVSRARAPEEPLAAVLRRELKVPQPQATLTIDDETYAFIASKTATVGESVSDILRRELNLTDGTPPAPPPPAPPSPAIVVFRIPPGTGSRSWNDGSSMVTAKVGDTLRIFNDDSVAHGLHTAGRPFPHPVRDIPSGQSADFILHTAYDPAADGPLTDHDQGPQAQFWIRVTPRS